MKKYLLSLAVGVFLFPMAYANDLEISNNTNQYLTFKINDACSTEAWGVFGLAHPYSKNKVPEKVFNRSCEATNEQCQLVVYAANKCSGTIISYVTIDTDVGVKGIKIVPNTDIAVAGHGFLLVFSGTKMQ
jgi:hypothetical protein